MSTESNVEKAGSNSSSGDFVAGTYSSDGSSLFVREAQEVGLARIEQSDSAYFDLPLMRQPARESAVHVPVDKRLEFDLRDLFRMFKPKVNDNSALWRSRSPNVIATHSAHLKASSQTHHGRSPRRRPSNLPHLC